MVSHRPLRILITFRGVDRKFASIFAGADNSFYVHPNRPQGQPWRIPGVARSSQGDRAVEIDFENFIEPELQLHKLSIHRSGFLGVTDRHGRRYQDGLKVPRFSEMVFPHQVCVVVPCHPESLPEYRPDRAHVARIPLVDNSGPFYLSVAVISAEQPLATVGATNLLFEDLAFGLSLTTHAVVDLATGGGPEWPPFPFLVLSAAV